jgi:hypothetical protein
MGGAWRAWKTQESLDAPLDLRLGGGAVSSHRPLHLGRRQGKEGNPALARRQTDDPASVAHQDRSLGVFVFAVEVFNHEERRGEAVEKAMDGVEKVLEPRVERSNLGGGDHAAVEDSEAAGAGLQHTPTGLD